MAKLRKIKAATGIYWVEVPEAQVYILCGCPADSVKHLMKKGMIAEREEGGFTFETGPNVILLSDVLIQNGSFSNLAEFPVLQMLYRQGMILPGHPNNTGVKPMLIGSDHQIKAQMQYIYRGNYGLVSKEEMIEAGISPENAEELMKMKLGFAFGKIVPSDELVDHRVITSEPSEIRNGVFARRVSPNVFKISYGDEYVTVDLNLSPSEEFDVPYQLGFHDIRREYFSIIHMGEGDGWDINRPCMSSIIIFQGRVYLVDAGPNIFHSLKSLGIGISEIEGVFHTHAHDDHFAGLMTLMRSDRRIKYFATPLVRASVMKKLSALASISEEHFKSYFDTHDLWADAWNEVDAIEVKPVISPHPVETTIFFFRVLGDRGYSTYAHLADIASKRVLEKMVADGGITQSYYNTVWSNYLSEAEIKKIDIGGGLIHGDAADFADDASEKIILSHTSLDLTNEQKKIGSSASFGMSDVLVEAHQVYIRRYAFSLLSSYFPSIPKDRLNILLNNPLITFNPETIMLKAGEPNEFIYLILTGNVEVIKDPGQINSILSSGGIAGEFSGLTRTPLGETYRTMNYVNALKISSNLYAEFVMLNEAFDDIMVRIERKDFLQHIWLFNEGLSFPVLSRVIAGMDQLSFDAGAKIRQGGDGGVYIVKEGKCELVANDEVLETLGTGDFFGESTVLLKSHDLYKVRVVEDTQLYFIEGHAIDDIPIVHLKLFEVYGKRIRKMLSPDRPGAVTFQWKDEYSIGVQEIDADHQKMFEAADRLNRALAHGEEDFVLYDILDFLISYTKEHFAREEAMMKMYSYDGLDAHAKRHAQLTDEVLSYRKKFETDKLSMDAGFTSFLSSWIVDHIMTEDRKCGAFLNEKSIY